MDSAKGSHGGLNNSQSSPAAAAAAAVAEPIAIASSWAPLKKSFKRELEANGEKDRQGHAIIDVTTTSTRH